MENDLEIIIQFIRNKIEGIRLTLPKHKLIFMLGNTVSKSPKQQPYSTPTRIYSNDVVVGAIVFNQVDAVILAKVFSPIVDFFYVDSEKKIPIDLNPDYEKLAKYSIKVENTNPELGNISAAIAGHVEKTKIRYYKANDLIVDAAWNFLIARYGELSGKKIVLVGLGNIGFKLALKLVESGVSIKIVGGDKERCERSVQTIMAIKNLGTLATVSLAENKEFELLNADCVVLAANESAVFGLGDIKILKQDSLIVDIGKGNISSEAVEYGIEFGIDIWRGDITGHLPLFLSTSYESLSAYGKKFGRRNLNGNFIISGGYVGKVDDVVVDDFNNPKQVIGVCDGNGGFLSMGSEELQLIQKSLLSGGE